MELLEEHRCFEGRQQRWRHDSTALNRAMQRLQATAKYNR